MVRRVHFDHWIPVDIERVFLFFANPLNLPRIMPPSSGTKLMNINLVPPPPPNGGESTVPDFANLAGVGSEIVTSFRLLPLLPFRGIWIARITEFEWHHHFADVQEQGPFKLFHHRHEFVRETRDGRKGTRMVDAIEYQVAFGPFGALAGWFVIPRVLQRIFKYRQNAVNGLLENSAYFIGST
jgi:ligand-binding SRPBCC domain-containing protein